MRSKLFVPGSRPDFFAKALASSADALSFDLEDSVAPPFKKEARQRLADLLGSDEPRGSGKQIILRTNAVGSGEFAADLAMLGGAFVHLVNLPKADDPAAVARACESITRSRPGARVLLTIESAQGLALAGALARAHPAVAGLQLGLNDLFEQLGVDRGEPQPARLAMWQLRLGAAEADLFAFDGAWPFLDDPAGFESEARMARSLGFLGKSCVHPRQVDIANRIFDRSDRQAEAQRIVEAARAAAERGEGAFRLDGRMIDGPAIERARQLLGDARDERA